MYFTVVFDPAALNYFLGSVIAVWVNTRSICCLVNLVSPLTEYDTSLPKVATDSVTMVCIVGGVRSGAKRAPRSSVSIDETGRCV